MVTLGVTFCQAPPPSVMSVRGHLDMLLLVAESLSTAFLSHGYCPSLLHIFPVVNTHAPVFGCLCVSLALCSSRLNA